MTQRFSYRMTHAGNAANRQKLAIIPIHLRTARAFVAWTHRHLPPPQNAEYAIGVATTDGTLVGVAIVDRPMTQAFDDGYTVEVIRLSTDGTPNACSALLAAAWREAKTMEYRRLVTSTFDGESGASLRAAGFRRIPDQSARPCWDAASCPQPSHGSNRVARVVWVITCGDQGGK